LISLTRKKPKFKILKTTCLNKMYNKNKT